MNTWMYAHLAVGLLLLAAPAGALVPDTMTIETDPDWVTAGSRDAATVTVRVSNSTSGNTPIAGVVVNFAVNETYGSIFPAQTVTDVDGMAVATFTPGTRSGDATITAGFSSLDVGTSSSTVCRIDHATPYRIENIWYSPEATVGETASITVRLADRYGNPVDNRNVTETVRFTVGSPNGTAAFVDADVKVDDTGNATATLRLDTMAGEHLVHIQPPAPVRGEYITIIGVGNGEPCTLDVDVQPDEGEPPHVYAGSDSRFLLTYTLRDGFGNPSPGKELVITTNVSNEKTSVITNAYGQARISYGPWVKPGGVIVTATAVENPSVSRSQPLAFVTSTPTNLFLSANPETMPSRDVPGCKPAEIRVKLVDQFNNPIPEKDISLQILDVDNGIYNQTQKPEITSGGVRTDASGIATVDFWPGAFTTDWRAPGYSSSATGTCKIVAEHGDISREILLTWKNYPYITVETDVTPETVTVNETVDVTIRLKGDGWALKPDPIDVILCMDRGARMVNGDEDHMVTVMGAAPIFVDQMIPGWDRVGLVSFGANGNVVISDNKQVCTLKEPDTKKSASTTVLMMMRDT